MSVDLGLYPIDTESSDEDMFTENVWWETADNLAFVSDDTGQILPQVRYANRKTRSQIF